ncbi:hypothetical protein D3C78_1520230 [compost metagenome]
MARQLAESRGEDRRRVEAVALGHQCGKGLGSIQQAQASQHPRSRQPVCLDDPAQAKPHNAGLILQAHEQDGRLLHLQAGERQAARNMRADGKGQARFADPAMPPEQGYMPARHPRFYGMAHRLQAGAHHVA